MWLIGLFIIFSCDDLCWLVVGVVVVIEVGDMVFFVGFLGVFGGVIVSGSVVWVGMVVVVIVLCGYVVIYLVVCNLVFNGFLVFGVFWGVFGLVIGVVNGLL